MASWNGNVCGKINLISSGVVLISQTAVICLAHYFYKGKSEGSINNNQTHCSLMSPGPDLFIFSATSQPTTDKTIEQPYLKLLAKKKWFAFSSNFGPIKLLLGILFSCLLCVSEGSGVWLWLVFEVRSGDTLTSLVLAADTHHCCCHAKHSHPGKVFHKLQNKSTSRTSQSNWRKKSIFLKENDDI